jgi:preprotein translocase subunit SecD
MSDIKKHVAWVLLVVVVSFGALGATLAANWRPFLGLDLRGGLSITYQPYLPGKKTVSSGQIATAINIIRNRINALGVAQPNVQSFGNDIIVQLPGIKDPQKAEAIIGTTAKLYFRPVLCQVPPYQPPKKGASVSTTLPSCPTYSASTFQNTANGPSNPPPLSNSPNAANYPNTPPGRDNPNSIVVLPYANQPEIRLELGPSPLDGTAIKSAFPELNNGQWGVGFTLSSAGAAKFNQLAQQEYHKDFAIVLDNQVISFPLMNATSFPGQGVISPMSQSEAQNLSLELSYGALPVSLRQLTAQTVSPTLGASSLKAGLAAGILGIILVLIYSIFYYRGLGVVVILGLATTGALLYSIICLLGQTIGTTLDLSGVTGLIVSIGITVDSYVVYFERLKDEIREGKSIRVSVSKAFKRAFKTVLFADAVSLIGAVVLWFFSIGAVKGFAFFLGLSTCLDILTAYAFTRPMVILLGRTRFFTELPVIGIARGLLAKEAV